MSWPTTTTSTTNIDADTDSIAEARFEIFKNFKDVNSITDEFNIGTPSANETFIYNSSTNKYDVTNTTGVANMGLFDFSTMPATTDQTLRFFQGTFTVQHGSSDLGITTSTNSDGDRIATFPAGSYVIQIPVMTSGAPTGTSTAGGFSYAGFVRWEKLDGTLLGPILSIARTDFSSRQWYYLYPNFTLTESTDVRFSYYSDNNTVPDIDLDHPLLTIRRL